MNSIAPGFKLPFGAESCEHEMAALQDHYKEYYYEQSRFNAEALDADTYLIVGRRGSGKTSLTKYFNFQERYKNAHSIDVDEPVIYNSIIQKISDHAYLLPDMAVNDVFKIWEYLIWSIIFYQFSDRDTVINQACFATGQKGKPLQFIRNVLSGLLMKYVDEKGRVLDDLSDQLASAIFTKAKEKVLEFTHAEPIFIAIDTFERYDRENMAMMAVTAALIQCASTFNIAYSHRGIHIKAFVSAEIFPHIRETIITNPAKFIRHPLYMSWRPKDLIRLISWRFQRYLQARSDTVPARDVDWDNFDNLLKKLWYPYFGETINNLHGIEEKSFPYILRHTQMRPRQLVILCNEIARATDKEGKFPVFKNIRIQQIVQQVEHELAAEVLNSYNLIYPRVSEIVTALTGAPMLFSGNYLDQVAKKTSDIWTTGYSLYNFRRLVAELGIVGKVRSKSETTGIVEADFEYAMQDRLTLSHNDECVIHPMFYSKLQIERNGWIVYPFPDHEDYNQFIRKD